MRSFREQQRPPRRSRHELLATLEKIEAELEWHSDCVESLLAERQDCERELEEWDAEEGEQET